MSGSKLDSFFWASLSLMLFSGSLSAQQIGPPIRKSILGRRVAITLIVGNPYKVQKDFELSAHPMSEDGVIDFSTDAPGFISRFITLGPDKTKKIKAFAEIPEGAVKSRSAYCVTEKSFLPSKRVESGFVGRACAEVILEQKELPSFQLP